MAKWARIIIMEGDDGQLELVKQRSLLKTTEVRDMGKLSYTCIELDAQDLTLFQCEIEKVKNG